MEIIKKNVRVNQIGKRITNQFVVEDDYNVPDSKADVGRIITGKGQLKIEETRPVEHYSKVMGKLHFHVLYVTDAGDAALASMEGQIPFEEMVYMEDGTDGNVQIRVDRVDFHTSMIHSRKLEIKAVVEISLHREYMEEEEAATALEADDRVFQKSRQVDFLQMYENKRDIYRIKEEFILPGTKENMEKLIWEDVVLRKLDTKLSQGMLQLSGELLVFCIYLSQEDKTCWVEQQIPFHGQIPCQGSDESFFHHVYRNLTDANLEMRLDEDGEMRVLGVDATLEMRILIYEEERMNLLEDAYSLEERCKLDTKRIFFEEMVMQNHSKCKLSEQLSLPEVRDEILQICHSSGEVQVEKMEVTPEGIQVEGILHMSFLYVKENDQIPFDVWSGMIPFSYLIECEGTDMNLRYDITYGLEQIAVELAGNGEIEVKAVLAFQSFVRRPMNLEMVDAIERVPFDEKEREKRPGIIGYVVKQGDELWDLAKKYGTTEESIKKVNELTSNSLKAGDKLLIFKENISIL